MNPWIALTLRATQLAWEAQQVIVLRLMRLALPGAPAKSEAGRMVSEKVAAFVEAQAAAATGTIAGGDGHRVATKVLNTYRKRVRKNKRRLSK